jgi:hypothetical protein
MFTLPEKSVCGRERASSSRKRVREVIHRLVEQVEDEAVRVAGVEQQARVRVLVVAGRGQPPRRPRASVPLTAPAIQSSVFLHAANREEEL